ncbi:hypothetical protein [Rhizobium sp. NPDC090279]|uniref:hypothetical protein n=1 Tax=Rhizobium sp. NPDC090279 TaxID=3364499 RepID=UPI00383B45F0
MKTAFAEVGARAAGLGTARRRSASAMPVHSAGHPSVTNDYLVYFAGLALTGYPDTSANLPR